MAHFTDKVVVITGGAGAIGKVTAEEFLAKGAKVVIVDLAADQLDEVKEDLQSRGEIHTIQADVTNETDVEKYVRETVDRYGKIDVFFNNAGIEGKVAPITEQKAEDLDKVLAVNVRGIFLGLKHVLAVMKEQKYGTVINTSSVAGLHGSSGVTPYIASKHAVVGLTKATAVEFAPYNVRVNSVHPSPANTRMMRSLEGGMGTDEGTLSKTIPLGRYAESSDVANMVLFLADDKSDFLTGGQYLVDGGMGAL
ncbi:SDR family NAD(P)-dependent oxidoreductase [Terribacillus sp. DMT04]|uniref:SDR family NAD(P)-dependent oxidoreductase n=1 Tax=Terribacillus sp. DMT04 TaxID=2850441 RepID=UPI001C2C36F0|nr:SDR family oxidoreductase [Terribacillus sp. DMT04]QXE01992.1 SDR family oxidoreductase [Terribacillus sp. DMT04]